MAAGDTYELQGTPKTCSNTGTREAVVELQMQHVDTSERCPASTGCPVRQAANRCPKVGWSTSNPARIYAGLPPGEYSRPEPTL